MSIEWNYMPILKWKRGEQFALRNLTCSQWLGVAPLIEFQPGGTGLEGPMHKDDIQKLLANKIKPEVERNIPADQFVFVDTSYLSLGHAKPGSVLVAVSEYLQKNTSPTIFPVINMAVIETIALLTATQIDFLKGQEAVLVRLRMDQVESSQVVPSISALVSMGIKRKNIHVLIDQFSLVDRNPIDCFNSVIHYLDAAFAAKCASVTVGGGSFPMFLMGLRQGVTDIIRVEWKTWGLLRSSGKYAELRYADYTVTNPAPLPDLDGASVNPAIAIRYATTNEWRLYKGRGFKSGAVGEYRNLCRLLLRDPIYSGRTFSHGDERYDFAANNAGTTNGNPWTWRKEATNHHIVFTSAQL